MSEWLYLHADPPCPIFYAPSQVCLRVNLLICVANVLFRELGSDDRSHQIEIAHQIVPVSLLVLALVYLIQILPSIEKVCYLDHQKHCFRVMYVAFFPDFSI